MSRRRNRVRKPKSHQAAAAGEGRSRRNSNSNSNSAFRLQLPRRASTKPPAYVANPFTPPPPPPPQPQPALPPETLRERAVTVDIRYASRHYRVHLPPPGEGAPKDATLEVVAWDGDLDAERMCWEHVCPRVLYCAAAAAGGCGNAGGGGGGRRESSAAAAAAVMEYQWEPALAEMVKRAAAALTARRAAIGV